jgi:hypothetical protein
MSPPTTGFRSARGDARTAAFVGILLAVALLITSASVFILWQSRIDTYRRADAASKIVLHAISQDLQRSIGAYDTAALGDQRAFHAGLCRGRRARAKTDAVPAI